MPDVGHLLPDSFPCGLHCRREVRGVLSMQIRPSRDGGSLYERMPLATISPISIERVAPVMGFAIAVSVALAGYSSRSRSAALEAQEVIGVEGHRRSDAQPTRSVTSAVTEAPQRKGGI